MYYYNSAHAQLQHRTLQLQQARNRVEELKRTTQHATEEIERLQGFIASQHATIKQQEEKLEDERSKVDAAQECAVFQKRRAEKRSQRLGEEMSRHDRTNTVLQSLVTTLSRFDVSGKVGGLHLGSLMMDVESRDQEIIELRAEIDLLRVELDDAQKALDAQRETQEQN